MAKEKCCFGVDVGGTTVKIGCFDKEGHLISKWEIPTRKESQGKYILPDVAESLKKRMEMDGIELENVQGIGIGVPGPVLANGTVERCVNLGWGHTDMKGILRQYFPGVDIEAGNDANVAALGEVWRGAGRGKKNAVMVTLGTGLGFSYYTDGKVHVNEKGSPARNLWNLPYGEGILEDVISARGIRNAYREKTGDGSQSAYTVAKLAFGGDIPALEVYDHVGSVLGEFLKDTLPDIRTDTLLVGGQISKSLSLMIRPLQNALEGIAILPVPEGAVFEGLSALLEPTTVY